MTCRFWWKIIAQVPWYTCPKQMTRGCDGHHFDIFWPCFNISDRHLAKDHRETAKFPSLTIQNRLFDILQIPWWLGWLVVSKWFERAAGMEAVTIFGMKHGQHGVGGKLETMEPRMPLPGYLYNNIWHSHGIDGPNRNRLFTVLKNGDFPWQTGNAITRCYHEIRTFPKGWLLCSPNIWSAQKPTNSEMGYELSGASNIPWETMGKTMAKFHDLRMAELGTNILRTWR